VRARLLAALVTAVALTSAPALAQDVTPTPSPTPTATPSPSPTPTPTPEPRPERSDEVKTIYRDYRRDGVIDACRHKRKDLREALDDLDPDADTETPDLRPQLEAAIDEHKSGECKRQAEEEQEQEQEQSGGTGTTGGGTTTPTPTPTTPSTPVTPVTPSTPAPSPVTPTSPPSKNDVTPIAPTPEPVAPPPAATPVPEPSGPVATPSTTYRNPDDGVPVAILVLAGLLALLALLALLYAALSRLGWAESRLEPIRRSWREAAFRMGGTWGDFSDWVRVGR
jgi:hypothetical protein